MIQVSIIAARSINGVIGLNGSIPWSIPRDIARFKTLTTGKPVIMGRKTWDSLPLKPLPDRSNIVMTRNYFSRIKGADISHDLDSIIKNTHADEIFIMGGAEIYAQAIPYANKMYLTEVLIFSDGDTYFPTFDHNEWVEVSRQEITGSPCFIFRELHRNNDKPALAVSVR